MTISVDWICDGCGTIIRAPITNVTNAVHVTRPVHWVIDRGQVKCETCMAAPPYEPRHAQPNPPLITSYQTQPGHITDAPPPEPGRLSEEERLRLTGEEVNPYTRADQLRERMSGLRVGQGGEEFGGQHRPVAQPAPAYMAPGAGGVSSAHVQQAQPNAEISGTEYRPGGVGSTVFVDTRKSEFLGPEKIVAGVPSQTERCIGCGMVIQDGTNGGTSEAWRTASNSAFERGHTNCLDRIGR